MTRGDKVKINFGTHKGATGTVAAQQEYARRKNLVWVDVPGVSRSLLYWPSDLELI